MNPKQTFMQRKFCGLLVSGTINMMVASVLVLSDTFIAGAFLGKEAVAGINLVTPMFSLAGFFGSIFSVGVPIIYNSEMGKFNKGGADKAFGFGLTMTMAIGVIMFVTLMIFGDSYLRFYGISDEVFGLSQSYFFWYKLNILIMPLSSLISAMVIADGDEMLPAAAGIVQFISNIAISLLLCGRFGIAGIGFGSFAGTALSFAVSLSHFLRKSSSLKANIYVSLKMTLLVIKYGIVDAGTYLFIAVLTAVLNRFVTAAYGADMLILVSVISIITELQLIFDGIGSAMTPITTIYLNENSFGGVKKMWSIAKKAAVFEGIAMTVTATLVAPLIPRVLGVTDAVTAVYMTGGARVAALGFTFTSLLYLASSYYLLVDRIPIAFIMCALRDVAISAPLAVIMGSTFGIYGMYAAFAIAPAAAYGISMLYIYRRYGKENYPLLIKEKEDEVMSFFYEITIEPEAIIRLQAEISGELEKQGIDKRIIGRIKLLVEELYMLIYEKNGQKSVRGECTMIIDKDKVSLITKDDGVLLDLAAEDVSAGTIGEYLISNYMRTLTGKQHLITMSYNRNVFEIKAEVNN